MFVAQGSSAASSSPQVTAAGSNFNWDAVAAVASALGVFVAIAGVWLILRQIAENRRQIKGNLISNLGDQLHKHSEIYQRFAPGRRPPAYREEPLTAEEIQKICDYLSFFEEVYLLIEEKMIDLETIDKLFAYRFFGVVGDSQVQEQILRKDGLGSYFASIFALYEIWERYRRAHGLAIIGTGLGLTSQANLSPLEEGSAS
jgi:hypothetical protein